MVSFPLGLLGGNTTYKHLTAMPCTHDSESPTASMKPCKLKSVDAGSHGPLSQWLGQWWSTVLWAWGWLEQWEHDVTWVLPWAFPTEV